jgi:hypothetical protein
MDITPVHVDVTVNRASRAVMSVREIQSLAVNYYDPKSITPISEQKPYSISPLNFTTIWDQASFRSIYDLKGKNILYHIMRIDNPMVTDDDFVKSPELLGKVGRKILAHFVA